MAAKLLRVALAQVMNNVDIDAICASAAETGAEIIVFPEMFSNGYSRFDSESEESRLAWIDAAVPIDGGYVEKFRHAARSNGLAVVATFLELGPNKPFNSAVLIDRTGEIILHQRKRHVCFFDVPEKACAAGESSSVAKLRTDAGEVAVGILICMDREFPDAASDLVRGGAEIILIPNSCRLSDDPAVGDVRVAGVRALAFQSVVGAAVANYPLPKDDGRSFAVDPLGKVLVMGGTQQELVIAHFNLEVIRVMQENEWFRRVR
ncbi:carbon-nitrogen hydrolase family protein [Sinorhizobium prairiense]|uniref:carbon-nitrogen hydrolase family protein n=1 Tax=unclassified Sinorhizobium TaxID=2613772 RepID=UPI0023D89738|nr:MULTISPECIES: carbon-nitrogen hydrolase family protein [unclassified Sinorhizobium]WEJ13870.1 carbon-nitrogen hydrolase family protein [Sinorhizobium sp. K101]WEJ35467.1 carbon-nitrogen hydrolase family protein [Sinorhizobium sp. C101]